MSYISLIIGKGWYRYEKPMSSISYPDPDVEAVIEEHSRAMGITRRKISPQVTIFIFLIMIY